MRSLCHVSSKAPSLCASRKGEMKLRAKKQSRKVFKKRHAFLGDSFFHKHFSTLSNMSTFSTAMNATSHYQNPNPNPNQAAYSSTTTDQLNELLDFELSDYVAFDGEFEEEISTRDTAKRSENVENNFNGSSSSSTPLASNMQVL